MNLLWISLLFMLLYTANGFFLRRFLHGSKCRPDEKQPWSYREKNGPKTWGQRYPTCNGREQSPIALRSHKAVRTLLPMLAMKNYNVPVTKGTIENNGHSIQVTPSDGVIRSIFVNNDIFKLTQLHFHWGDNPDRGSEHTLNGMRYSMELHFVHQNAKRDIAVVGVFFLEESMKNAELQNIVCHFPMVMYNGTRSDLKTSLNLNNLLPENPSSYFRYQGSLTTPGCDEGVTWSVLTMIMSVGNDQMKEFRNLYSVNKSDATKSCRLTDNYRPVQPLNGRKVYLSQ